MGDSSCEDALDRTAAFILECIKNGNVIRNDFGSAMAKILKEKYGITENSSKNEVIEKMKQYISDIGVEMNSVSEVSDYLYQIDMALINQTPEYKKRWQEIYLNWTSDNEEKYSVEIKATPTVPVSSVNGIDDDNGADNENGVDETEEDNTNEEDTEGDDNLNGTPAAHAPQVEISDTDTESKLNQIINAIKKGTVTASAAVTALEKLGIIPEVKDLLNKVLFTFEFNGKVYKVYYRKLLDREWKYRINNN